MPSACGVILARGGSKRIPGKNIRPFNGQPMVAWPVQAAIACGKFSSVIISTDSPEIETEACAHGAISLGLRPPHLADDFSTTAQVLAFFCKDLANKQKKLPEFLCCLYGTSVFATPALLQAGLEKLRQADCDCALAVSEYRHPIERALTFSPKGIIQYIDARQASTRTQDCTTAYHDIGLFYWLRVTSFLALKEPSFIPLRKTAIVVPAHKAVDIDNDEDWHFAELVMQYAKIKP